MLILVLVAVMCWWLTIRRLQGVVVAVVRWEVVLVLLLTGARLQHPQPPATP